MRALIAIFLVVLATAAAFAEKPDPNVTLEVVSPTEKTSFLPNSTVHVEARVDDPFELVRRVFVRFATERGQALNTVGEAAKRGDRWMLDLEVPGSTPAGTYLVNVEVLGDGGTPLQWKTLPIAVEAAKFGLKVVSPTPDAAFHRNESFDIVAQVDDPRKKARRVFVYFEDARRKMILNGDREAQRRGNLWSQRVHIPATAIPGPYVVTVEVRGEGAERLALQEVTVSIEQAPVTVGGIDVQPAGKIYAGDTVRFTAPINDPRQVVRRVEVTVVGPGGAVLSKTDARRSSTGWTSDCLIPEDNPSGTYRVEYRVLAQGDEVVRTTQNVFPVLPARH